MHIVWHTSRLSYKQIANNRHISVIDSQDGLNLYICKDIGNPTSLDKHLSHCIGRNNQISQMSFFCLLN